MIVDSPVLHKGHLTVLKELDGVCFVLVFNSSHRGLTGSKVNINHVNNKGITAVQVACTRGAYDFVKGLLAKGVSSYCANALTEEIV